MNEYYRDKVAVVTGAASGIGLGMVEKLLACGAKAVFMGDLDEKRLADESQRLERDHPGKVFAVPTDVTELAQVERLVLSARDHAGHLDFLFNNAGVGMTVPTEQVTFDIWKFIVNLNLMGVIYGTYTAIPIMRAQRSGHIVSTGSAAGLMPVAYQAVYAASKSAVISMSESLRYELESEGLRFSTFNPGNIATNNFRGLEKLPDDVVSVEEAMEYLFAELAKGLSQVLNEAGYGLLISSSQEQTALEEQQIDQMLARGVDALLLASVQATPDAVAEISKRKVVCVLIDRCFPGWTEGR